MTGKIVYYTCDVIRECSRWQPVKRPQADFVDDGGLLHDDSDMGWPRNEISASVNRVTESGRDSIASQQCRRWLHLIKIHFPRESLAEIFTFLGAC